MWNAMRWGRSMPALVLLLGLLAGAGCRLREVRVRAAEPGLSQQVNVIGISEAELKYWRERSVDDYWASAERHQQPFKERTQEVFFGVGRADIFVLTLKKRTNKVYRLWRERKYTHAVVLLDRVGGSPGSADCRRLILPLDPDLWRGGRRVLITIEDSCLRLLGPLAVHTE